MEHRGKLVKSVAQFFSVNKWPSIIYLTRILPFLSMFTHCIKSFVQLAIELLVLYHLNCSVFTLLSIEWSTHQTGVYNYITSQVGANLMNDWCFNSV